MFGRSNYKQLKVRKTTSSLIVELVWLIVQGLNNFYMSSCYSASHILVNSSIYLKSTNSTIIFYLQYYWASWFWNMTICVIYFTCNKCIVPKQQVLNNSCLYVRIKKMKKWKYCTNLKYVQDPHSHGVSKSKFHTTLHDPHVVLIYPVPQIR